MQKSIGQTLLHMRKTRGLTMQQVSDATHLNLRLICEVENGKRDIRLSTLKKLLAAYGSGLFLSSKTPL